MSWFLAFAGFCFLIVAHEAGHFAAAKAVGMRVERFSLFFPPLLVRKKWGETEYAIGLIPAGGYVKISGMSPAEDLPEEVRDRAYHAQPVWKRVVVIAAGPLVNLVLAFVLLLVYFGVYGPLDTSHKISVIEKGYAAQGVLHPDDQLVSVDGRTGTPETLGKIVASHKCRGDAKVKGCSATRPATVVVNRKGKLQTFKLVPKYDPDAKKTRLGFGYGSYNRHVPFSQAISISANRFWFVTTQTLSLPAKLIDPQQRKQLSGVVGTYETTRKAILAEPRDAIAILALISLSLAIVNLFPFLPLDGGHIFWAIVEKVRSRPVSLRTMERASVVGFMLVMLIFVIGLSNDIGRLTGDGFRVR
ncbi:MAG: regulator of sigma protease [Thermoleophilaceae bacterium]|jgi:regulator of sigma E protease|nr:regulator of sigma protease [Thermoleophilaceae bacterium]